MFGFLSNMRHSLSWICDEPIHTYGPRHHCIKVYKSITFRSSVWEMLDEVLCVSFNARNVICKPFSRAKLLLEGHFRPPTSLKIVYSHGTNYEHSFCDGMQIVSFPAKWLQINMSTLAYQPLWIVLPNLHHKTWWPHQMEAFSALLAICAGNSPVAGEFPAQRPVTTRAQL